MTDRYKVIIVGGGPAGLSASAHATSLGLSHILLEMSEQHAETVQRYQKGKHVMAEPNILPLRSDIKFAAGTREEVLEGWQIGINETGLNVRYSTEVVAIAGSAPSIQIKTASGDSLETENVVFAIGVQGSPRKLGVEGESGATVQYTLDDPGRYQNQTIVVVGAGDAAIENVLALAKQNTVFLVNRRDEFARAKDGNRTQILRAIEDESVGCFYESSVARIESDADGNDYEGKPHCAIVNTRNGEARVPCDLIIARLGAIPQRKLAESCGITFPNEDPAAIPQLSSRYESDRAGLFVIGALGGYPLIKQAMNQGFEVIEYIAGNDIEPADQPVLADKFRPLPFGLDVNATLALMQEKIPLFSGINALVFRELILSSDIRMPGSGEAIFRKNDYTDTFFTILGGSIRIALEDGSDTVLSLGPGQFFGEMSLLSGRRRSATATAGEDCVLIETPRLTMNKLINSIDRVRDYIDREFILRAVQSTFAPQATLEELRELVSAISVHALKSGETLFEEGDTADRLHLIRSGSVAVSRQVGGREIVTAYVAAGNYVGEMGLLGRTKRTATVRATVPTQTISLDEKTFNQLLKANPGLKESVQATMRDRITENARMEAQPEAGDIISFLMQQGVGEATDVLLIDETLCVGCDNCEVACAETHAGTSRLDRAAGPTYASVHVPTSCRHCEDPHCMTDCPPDAIRRAPNGEVFIMDNCIGCGNCERNCPYDVIQMAATPPQKPGLAQWLFFGRGPGPGGQTVDAGSDAQKKAVKCDMCKDLSGGPACVRACPTGAALRIGPEDLVSLVQRTRPF